MGDREIRQKITPTLMFVGEQCGRAEEAIHFYASVFPNAKVGHVLRYGENEEPDRVGTIKHACFALEGESFAVMDSARAHNFTFNEAISFIVHCNTQEEIDYFWSKLSAEPKAEQCGWLKDKFGLSWQVVPTVMDEMLSDKDPEKLARVTQEFPRNLISPNCSKHTAKRWRLLSPSQEESRIGGEAHAAVSIQDHRSK